MTQDASLRRNCSTTELRGKRRKNRQHQATHTSQSASTIASPVYLVSEEFSLSFAYDEGRGGVISPPFPTLLVAGDQLWEWAKVVGGAKQVVGGVHSGKKTLCGGTLGICMLLGASPGRGAYCPEACCNLGPGKGMEES